MINCEKNAGERRLFIVKLRKEKVYFNLLAILKKNSNKCFQILLEYLRVAMLSSCLQYIVVFILFILFSLKKTQNIYRQYLPRDPRAAPDGGGNTPIRCLLPAIK